MISCTEFIPAYNELFKFLEKKGGKKAVIDFWNYISDNYLTNLNELMKKYGLKGCWLYWTKTLNEEAADFKMILDEKNNVFRIIMYKCPSKGRLMKIKHVKPYRDYCEHCDVLYRRIIESFGYDYYLDLSKCDKAKCKFVIKKI
ncbi:MAG TPA: hypothetical protein PK165_02280 [bacterium]|nr:hypothetical protein [bacterium]HOL49434.1 hypothetical protein [bacterium]HPO51645.1 hypothetical protein [bacterium]HXK44448.1 hypothetical protein [bacterium]